MGIIKSLKKLFSSNSWEEIKEKDLPKWLKRAITKSEITFQKRYGYEPWNRIFYFKGKTFRYKVWSEAQGQKYGITHYYRKLRKK